MGIKKFLFGDEENEVKTVYIVAVKKSKDSKPRYYSGIRSEGGVLNKKYYWKTTKDINEAYFFNIKDSADNRYKLMDLDNINYTESEVQYVNIPKKTKIKPDYNRNLRNSKTWTSKDENGIKHYDEGGYLQEPLF